MKNIFIIISIIGIVGLVIFLASNKDNLKTRSNLASSTAGFSEPLNHRGQTKSASDQTVDLDTEEKAQFGSGLEQRKILEKGPTSNKVIGPKEKQIEAPQEDPIGDTPAIKTKSSKSDILQAIGIRQQKISISDYAKSLAHPTDLEFNQINEMIKRGVKEMNITKLQGDVIWVNPDALVPICKVTRDIAFDVAAKVDWNGKLTHAVDLTASREVPSEIFNCTYRPIFRNSQPTDVSVIFRRKK